MLNYDVYSTLATITGAQVKRGEAIDSLDMSGVLFAGEESPRTKHIFYFHRPMAWRNGDYKIHFSTRERTRDPETGANEPSIPHDPPLLFNVREDPAERRDIAAANPELVARLTREFEYAKKAVKNGEKF